MLHVWCCVQARYALKLKNLMVYVKVGRCVDVCVCACVSERVCLCVCMCICVCALGMKLKNLTLYGENLLVRGRLCVCVSE